ncbi:phage portal protein, partial [Erythrobacter sp.]|uniref:phage portal protein n=1 Tax=Erythrobacter sp. TaxID=1042 RepID=UPI00311E722F
MSFLTTLVSAFKGGAISHVPLTRGYISPWTTSFESIPGRAPFDYPAAVAEAYLANPVAQRAVRIVAEGVGGAPLSCADARLARLIACSCGAQPLLEVLGAQLALHGNAYVQIVKDGAGTPVELFPLRPERVQVLAGEDGWPTAYRYVLADRTLTIA